MNNRNPKISVVLNVYKRGQHFERQLEAIRAQTIKPFEILVWENGEDRVPDRLREGLIVASCSENLGVWARFAFALNAKGDFVCVFDDDCIPGDMWFENCIETANETNGLLGTRGLIFSNPRLYSSYQDIGVYGPNDEACEVDIVGHSWFFRRTHLGAFWSQYANRFPADLAGEDLHFSFAVQQTLGLSTWVPPHPLGSPRKWGALPEVSLSLGNDKAAISNRLSSLNRFQSAFDHYRRIGLRVIFDSQLTSFTNQKKVLSSVLSIRPSFWYRLASFKVLRLLAKRLGIWKPPG